jgi:hypothetical protein
LIHCLAAVGESSRILVRQQVILFLNREENSLLPALKYALGQNVKGEWDKRVYFFDQRPSKYDAAVLKSLLVLDFNNIVEGRL